ncbi:MAG: hypothetical protein WBF17_06090 [Phycisphaerae bacterium]
MTLRFAGEESRIMTKASWRLVVGALVLCIASGFAGALIGRLACGTADPAWGAKDELPDSLTFPSAAEAKQALVQDAYLDIDYIRKQATGNPAVAGNCMAAMQQVQWFDQGRKMPPLMVHGSLGGSKGERSLGFEGINSYRETDEVIVLAVTSEGTIIRVVTKFGFSTKDAGLNSNTALLVKFVPVSEIVSSGVKQASGEVLVQVDFDVFTSMPLPDGLPLAVGIRDRNGLMSNFVPVSRGPSAKSTQGTQGAAPATGRDR